MTPVNKKKYVLACITALTFACSPSVPDEKAAAKAIHACVERELFTASAAGAAIPNTISSVLVDECRESSPGIATCVARIEISTHGDLRPTTTLAHYLLHREGGVWVARISTSH